MVKLQIYSVVTIYLGWRRKFKYLLKLYYIPIYSLCFACFSHLHGSLASILTTLSTKMNEGLFATCMDNDRRMIIKKIGSRERMIIKLLKQTSSAIIMHHIECSSWTSNPCFVTSHFNLIVVSKSSQN